MLAKAHVTIGMAAAFTAAQPQTIPEALPVIVGASLGCLICDIDCDIATEKTDSSHWRMVMAAVAVRLFSFFACARTGNSLCVARVPDGRIAICHSVRNPPGARSHEQTPCEAVVSSQEGR